jgi:hypothetical protein
MTELLHQGQFVVGLARVDDVLIAVVLRVKATRAEAVDMMKRLLPAAMRHLDQAQVPPPRNQWVSPAGSDPALVQPAETGTPSDLPVPTVTVTVTR